MMQMIFTVLDMAAKRFTEPFFAANEEVAIRSFREAVNSDGHPFSKFPEDYALYKVGDWDNESGAIVPLEPVKLVNASALTQGFGNQLELEVNSA